MQDDEKIIVESRVRFLSFLGIGRQVENCGFIVHTANDVYIAHILCCHPSSGAICKTIEAACKVKKIRKCYLLFNLTQFKNIPNISKSDFNNEETSVNIGYTNNKRKEINNRYMELAFKKAKTKDILKSETKEKNKIKPFFDEYEANDYIQNNNVTNIKYYNNNNMI